MRRWVVVLLIGGLLVSGVSPALADEPTSANATVSGASVTFTDSKASKWLSRMRDLAQEYPVSVKEHAFMLQTENRAWVVFTDERLQVAEATVTGYKIPTRTVGFIFANSVSWDTNPTSVSYKSTIQNPNQHQYELVQFTTTYRQLSWSGDIAGGKFRDQRVVGTTTTGNFLYSSPLRQPGRFAHWAVTNLSQRKNWQSRLVSMGLRTTATGKTALVFGDGSHFTVNGKVRVTAVVLNRGPYQSPSQESATASFYLRSVNPVAKSIGGPDEIVQRGAQLTGDVVRFKTQLVGTKISTKDTLVKLSSCGQDAVFVAPASTCVPAIVDTTMHTGVLFSGVPDGFSDVVVYAGLSNREVRGVSDPQTGTYRVTGRVVSTDQIDPRLPDGYALIVYQLERTGPLTAKSQAKETARGLATQAKQYLVSQANASDSQWRQMRRKAENPQKETPTPTPKKPVQVVASAVNRTKVAPAEGVKITVTIKNTAKRKVTRELQIQQNGEPSDAVQKITLKPGEKRTITFEWWAADTGTFDLSLKGHRIATISVVSETAPSERASSASNTDKNPGQNMVISVLPPLFSVLGIILILSAVIGAVLRSIKKYFGEGVNTSEQVWVRVLASGAGLLVLQAVFSPSWSQLSIALIGALLLFSIVFVKVGEWTYEHV